MTSRRKGANHRLSPGLPPDAMYSRRTLELLRRACSFDPATAAVLARRFGKSAGERAAACAVHVTASRVIRHRQHIAAVRTANREAQPLLAYLDLAALFAQDLINVAMFRADSGGHVLWDVPEDGQTPPPSALLIGLLSNFISSETALRELVARGFNAPARVLFRSQAEVCDLLLACVLNRDFFEKYRAWPEDEPDAQRYWRKHLGPAFVRDLLAGIYNTPELPPAIREKAIASRRERYGALSQFAHGQPTALRAGALEQDLQTGDLVWAPSGVFGSAAVALLDDALLHHFEFFMLLVHGLAGRHGWAMDNSDEAADIALHWATLQRLPFLLHPDVRKQSAVRVTRPSTSGGAAGGATGRPRGEAGSGGRRITRRGGGGGRSRGKSRRPSR
jgi:hypothetical protein